MTLDGILDELVLTDAVAAELRARNRLMPPRWDRYALTAHAEEVGKWLYPQYATGRFGKLADVVFVEKSRSGVRPISEFTLADRVLFRALVTYLADKLPTNLVDRPPISEFYSAPLGAPSANYISKTDVASYYEFIDHEMLAAELLAQTGEAPAINALMDLLEGIMGRRLGLPQIHKSSDVLGDVYIDPVRRRMRRTGFEVFTYSDDFRIASSTLAEARAALEECASEVRGLGLVLNEGKTFTYGRDKYEASLTSFGEAERSLFDGATGEILLLNDTDYTDPDQGEPAGLFVSDDEQSFGVPEDDAILDSAEIDSSGEPGPSQAMIDAAEHAWRLWAADTDSHESLSHQDAAITLQLLGKALPILGSDGNLDPLEHLSKMLRREPAVAPKVARYLIELGSSSDNKARAAARSTLDRLVTEQSFSVWQQMWLAEAAGRVRRSKGDRPLYGWLRACVESAVAPLAATSAAALGRLGLGPIESMVGSLDRVGPKWRELVLWGICKIDLDRAQECADNKMERILIDSMQGG